MKFSEKAMYYRTVREKDPSRFKINKRNVLQLTERVSLIVRTNVGLSEQRQHNIHYVEQDPNNLTQPEGQLVRMGIWKSREVGWLWTVLSENRICFLAKITPKEKIDLNPGWITEQGVFIVDYDYTDILEKQE